AEIDIVGVELRETLDLLVPAHHRATCGDDAATVAVAVCGGQSREHVLHDLVRRLESECRRISGVELEDVVSLGLESGGLDECFTTNLVEDVLKLRRLVELT